MKAERARVLMSVQRALLGAITSQVRTVDVCWNESEIRIRFVIDGEVKPLLLDEIAIDVETEVLGDFLPDVDVSASVVRIDNGSPIVEFTPLTGGTARVFARYEQKSEGLSVSEDSDWQPVTNPTMISPTYPVE